jgi:sulfate permease, SulP family
MSTARDHDLRRLLHSLRNGWRSFRSTYQGEALHGLPIFQTLRQYSWSQFKADLRAACNVSLMDLPQGMAYASVAGLPLQYGPTCSVVGSTVSPLFSSSRLTITGPTNATAFMVFSYFAAYPQLDRLMLMPTLVLMVGVLLLMGAFLRLADLSQYISRTVTVAYVTGAAILIMVNQIPSVLGIHLNLPGANGQITQPRTLPGILWHTLLQIQNSQWTGVLAAVAAMLSWWIVRKKRPRWPAFMIALLTASLIAWGMRYNNLSMETFRVEGFSWRSLIPRLPDFTAEGSLSEISRLFGLAVALAFISTLESGSMARSMASKTGHAVNPNQDMLALGMSNLASAYLSGMPASGSLTRSALNHSSGAVTQVASILNGLFCLAGALLLMPLIQYVPKAALSMLIILVSVSLINKRQIRISLFSTNSDAVVFLVTLIFTLLVPLHVAIFIGVGVSIILYLRKAARPQLIEYEFNQEGNLAEANQGPRQNESISIVHVEGDLFFGASELFRTQMQRIIADPHLRIIILRLKNARHLDSTSVMALEELVHLMRSNNRHLLVSGAMKEVYRVLKDSGVLDIIGRENLFPGSPTNPNLSTRNALKRAQAILGHKDAEVRIYFDPNKK